jgi:tetratricopeptide (TPR) repeat protein
MPYRSWVVVLLLLGQTYAIEGPDCSPKAIAQDVQQGHEHARVGEYVAAENIFAVVLACERQSPPAPDLHIAVTLTNLGELKRLQRKFKDAEILLTEAAQLLENAGLTEHLAFGGVQLSLAAIHSDRKQYYLAEPLVRRAIRIFDGSPGPDSRLAAAAANTLAVLCAELGDTEGAERQFRAALRRRQNSPPDVSTATIEHNLGRTLLRLGRVDEAEGWLLKSLELRSQLLGNRNASTRLTLELYGNILKATGRKAEARQLRTRMRQDDGKVHGR